MLENHNVTNDAIRSCVERNWDKLSAKLFEQYAPLDRFEVETLKHKIVAAGTAGLWRVSGVTAGSDPRRYSFVIKRLMPTTAGSARWRVSDAQDDPFYWAREALVYESGFFEGDGKSVRSAQCYVIDDEPPGVSLFLEDVSGRFGSDWSLPDYSVAANLLGTYHRSESLDVDERLSRPNAFFMEYINRRARFLGNVQDIMSGPAPYVDNELREFVPAIERIWVYRDHLLAQSALSPLTRCHFDFWSPNLFLTEHNDNAQLVAIDLAFAGIGNLGHDVANLIADGVLDFFIDAEAAHDVWEHVRLSYLNAVDPAGAREHIERTMETTIAMKYAWMIPATFQVARSEEACHELQREHGDIAAFFSRRSTGLRFIAHFVERVSKMV